MIFCSTYDFLLHLSICWKKLYYIYYKNQHRPTKLKGPHINFWLPINKGKVFSCEVLFRLFLINHYFIIELHSGSTCSREISIFDFSVVFLSNTTILYHCFQDLSIVSTKFLIINFIFIIKNCIFLQIYLLFHFPFFLLLLHIYYK